MSRTTLTFLAVTLAVLYCASAASALKMQTCTTHQIAVVLNMPKEDVKTLIGQIAKSDAAQITLADPTEGSTADTHPVMITLDASTNCYVPIAPYLPHNEGNMAFFQVPYVHHKLAKKRVSSFLPMAFVNNEYGMSEMTALGSGHRLATFKVDTDVGKDHGMWALTADAAPLLTVTYSVTDADPDFISIKVMRKDRMWRVVEAAKQLPNLAYASKDGFKCSDMAFDFDHKTSRARRIVGTLELGAALAQYLPGVPAQTVALSATDDSAVAFEFESQWTAYAGCSTTHVV